MSWQYVWVTLRVSTYVFHLQKDCPSGELSRKKFLAIYSSLFPEGKAGAFYQHVFRTFDADGSGRIDFKEFLQVISAHFSYMYIHVGTCIRHCHMMTISHFWILSAQNNITLCLVRKYVLAMTNFHRSVWSLLKLVVSTINRMTTRCYSQTVSACPVYIHVARL